LDQVMLQSMVGPNAVGTYAVAAKLSEAWYFVPAAIVASTFPAVVRQQSGDRDMYLRRLRHLMIVLVLLSYAAAALGMVLARPLIAWLYGVAYADAAPILMVHIWCGLFVCLGIASGSWIMAERKTHLNLLRNLLGAGINVALNFVLIPLYQGLGAAVATLIAFASAYLLFDFLVPQMREMRDAKLRALLLWR
jgi:O-antigen/teichoic acid export membrane protein